MHESSLVISILEITKETVLAHKAGRVSKITLAVGELVSVETQALVSCFEVFSEGTSAQGAELEFERIPAMKKCLTCGLEFARLEALERCTCGGELRVVSGREFYLKSLDLEDMPEQTQSDTESDSMTNSS